MVAESIQSVMQQTYPKWELIVVDDNSTDTTRQIVRALAAKDPRIRLYCNPQSSLGKPFAPRNIGIKKAKGRFIAFLDSNDLWLSYKLEEQLGTFARTGADIVYSNYEKIDERSVRSGRLVEAPMQVDYEQLLHENVLGMVTCIYDTTRIGKQYFENVCHEDYAYWLHILKQGYKARNTGTTTGLYRILPGSTSSNKLLCATWQWHILRRVEHLPLPKAMYCFACYAIRGLKKFMI